MVLKSMSSPLTDGKKPQPTITHSLGNSLSDLQEQENDHAHEVKFKLGKINSPQKGM